jgi:hypothetical protein
MRSRNSSLSFKSNPKSVVQKPIIFLTRASIEKESNDSIFHSVGSASSLINQAKPHNIRQEPFPASPSFSNWNRNKKLHKKASSMSYLGLASKNKRGEKKKSTSHNHLKHGYIPKRGREDERRQYAQNGLDLWTSFSDKKPLM